MTPVCWRRLVLYGFGRFAGSVSLELGPGLNVLVAPNEAGKSTLFAGLAAVLFGLPTGGGPEEFGQGRWRNWSNPARFAGELELEAGGTRYRLERDFGSHRVRVAELTNQGWRELLSGEHNPGARRRNVRYEEFLQATLGLASRELFMSTFSLGQPLPDPHNLDVRVQQLVSGAGTAAYQDALNYLVAGVRALTKYSKELGVTDRNAVKDGRLEELDQRIAALEQAIAASRSAADSLEVLQAEIHRFQQAEADARRRLAEAETALRAWTQWRALLDRRRLLLQRQLQLDHAVATVQKLEAAREEEVRRLVAQFPELAAHEESPALGRLLAQLEQLEERIRSARQALAGELEGLRARTAELAEAWREYRVQREHLGRLEAELRGLDVFDAAGEALREKLAGYTAWRLRLERAVEDAHNALARWREPRERYAAEQARFAQSFADLDALGDNALGAVQERLVRMEQREQAEQSLRALEETFRTVRGSHRRRLGLVWFLGLALGGFLAYALSATAGWVGALAVLLATVIGLEIVTRRLARPVQDLAAQVRAGARRLEELERALAEDERFAGMGPAELGALRERLWARAEAAAALEGLRRNLPSPDQEQELLDRIREAEHALAEFLAATAPARERFGEDIEVAFRRWLALKQDAEAVRAAIVAFAQRHAGRATTRPEEVPAAGLPGLWGELARLLAATGREVRTMGDLAEQLSALPDVFWEEARVVGERQDPLARWLAEAADLRQRLAPVLAAAGGDAAKARERWEAWRAGQDELERLAVQRDSVLNAHAVSTVAALRERLLDAANQAAALWQEMEALRAAHPTLPHPDEAGDSDDLETRLRRLEAERDRWRTEAEQAGAAARRLLEEQARLAGSRVINIAQAGEELKALRRERESVALDAQAMARAHQELQAAVKEYQAAHRTRLADAASRHFRRFTGLGRRVELDEVFAVTVREPDGRPCAVAQLSRGAQDQLYLALRLAIAELVSGEVPLPLLLDDPFVHCDAARLERIREALAEVSRQRQVVLFTHRQDLAAWGRGVQVVTGGGPPVLTGA